MSRLVEDSEDEHSDGDESCGVDETLPQPLGRVIGLVQIGMVVGVVTTLDAPGVGVHPDARSHDREGLRNKIEGTRGVFLTWVMQRGTEKVRRRSIWPWPNLSTCGFGGGTATELKLEYP